MATFQQIPGDMGITFVIGDELNVGLAFTVPGSPSTPLDLTGYTFEAKVFVPTYANPDGGLGSGNYVIGSTAATFTVSAVSLSGGTLSIGLTETQTSALSAATGYRWYFRWIDPSGVTLTPISGTFTARIP